MNNSCEFCSTILTRKQAEQWSHDIDTYEDTPIEYNVISRDSKSSTPTFDLWNRCDDCYYNGIIMQISYCPKCGRKLI